MMVRFVFDALCSRITFYLVAIAKRRKNLKQFAGHYSILEKSKVLKSTENSHRIGIKEGNRTLFGQAGEWLGG